MALPSAGYGEGVETAAIQGGAPMAKTPDVKGMSRTEMGMAPSQLGPVTSLYAPTERPDEPITSGIAMGPGPGPEVMGMSGAAQRDQDIVAKYKPLLEIMAAMPDTPESFRIFVRNI